MARRYVYRIPVIAEVADALKGFGRVDDATEEMRRETHKLESSYTRLGARSSASFDRQRKSATAAFEAIRDSGTASNRDIANAQRALQRRLDRINTQVRNSSATWRLYSASLTRATAAMLLFRRASTAPGGAVGRGGLAGIAGVAGAVSVASRSIASGLSSIAKAAGGAFAGLTITGGIASVQYARGVANTAGEFERLETALKQTLGADFERGSKFVADYARTVAFSQSEITDSLLRLRNFGFDQGGAETAITATVDQVAKLGGGYEELSSIVLALGQANAKQKLQGEEILQLVERGVPVWALLEKVTGKNVAQLQKLASAGKLGKKVIAALIQEIGKSAKGAAAAQLNTFKGLGLQLEIAINDIKKGTAASGVFDGVKNETRSLIDFLKRPAVQALSDQLGAIGTSTLARANALSQQLTLSLGPKVLDTLQRFIDRVFAFVGDAPKLDGIFNGVVRVMESAVEIFSRLGSVAVAAAPGIAAALSGIFDSISSQLSRVNPAAISGFAKAVGDGLGSIISAGGDFIAKVDGVALAAAAQSIAELVNGLASLFASSGASGAGAGVINGFFAGLRSSVEALTRDLTQLSKIGFSKAFETTFFESIRSFVNDDLPRILSAIENLGNLVNSVARFFGIDAKTNDATSTALKPGHGVVASGVNANADREAKTDAFLADVIAKLRAASNPRGVISNLPIRPGSTSGAQLSPVIVSIRDVDLPMQADLTDNRVRSALERIKADEARRQGGGRVTTRAGS